MISRWTPVVGVLRGNWAASNRVNLSLLQMGKFRVNNADDPDIRRWTTMGQRPQFRPTDHELALLRPHDHQPIRSHR